MSRSSPNGTTRHRPRTYGEACEELGGAPWRSLEGTEQWFLIDDPGDDADPQADERPSSFDGSSSAVLVDPTIGLEAGMDTAAFRIPARGLFDVVNWRWLLASTLVLGVLIAGAAASSARPSAAAIAALQPPATAAPAAVAPAVAAPAVAAPAVAAPAVAAPAVAAPGPRPAPAPPAPIAAPAHVAPAAAAHVKPARRVFAKRRRRAR